MRTNLLRHLVALAAIGSAAQGVAQDYRAAQYQPNRYQASQYGAQSYGAQSYGAQPYGAQPYGAQPYQAQPHQAQPYRAPARWNQFRPVSDQSDSLLENLPAPADHGGPMNLNAPMESVPAPRGQLDAPRMQHHHGHSGGHPTPAPQIQQVPQAHSVPHAQPAPYAQSAPYVPSTPHVHHSTPSYPVDGYSMAAPSSDCNSCGNGYSSPYASAMSAPWSSGEQAAASCGIAPARPELYPWFGSGNVLFLNLETGSGRRVFRNYGWDTSLVDPDSSVGFDVTAGRYLGCGRFGLGVRYFGWDPGAEESINTIPVATPADSFMPHYEDIGYNSNGTGQYSLDEHIDGTAGAGTADTFQAANVRIRRDLSFQGIEVNLFSFGLMGGQRVADANCGGGGLLGNHHGGRFGYGGADGALARSCSGRVRVQTSHGFRWFQAEDELEYAYNIDGGAGYADNDLYDNFAVENNLFGYQFGSKLTYCLGHNLTANIGGKIGIYGNDVDVRHRIGSTTTTAYVATDNTNRIDREASDTVLASLGELDLGLGYRFNNAWSVHGGYRLIGLTGVANAVDSYPSYDDVTQLSVDADNSYLIHGGYVGLEFNW